MSGPLSGYRVVEFAGIGPGPFAAMMLADMGADVVRVDRASSVEAPVPTYDFVGRGRRSIAVDLKHPEAVDLVLTLLENAHGLIEGFRPGVMERLGLGPDVCLARKESLIYGRMTGWGQDGPYAQVAGHDINYIALAGALEPIGRAGQAPTPPLNLVGDYGGGGLMLAFGMVCALLEAEKSGRGQVVDAAMVDGAALLMTVFHQMSAQGTWRPERGTNLIDSGAPFYDVYECADHTYVALGAIEPQFYALLRKLAGLSDSVFDDQMDRERWPEAKTRVAEVIKTKTRDEWCALLEHTDACFAPVLSIAEAPKHPHHVARGTFADIFGAVQPAPAPRFSRSDARVERPAPRPGEHSVEVLTAFGFSKEDVAALLAAGVVASS